MSMLKTIGTVFIGIGMAGVAISAVSKIVKISQEKKTRLKHQRLVSQSFPCQLKRLRLQDLNLHKSVT